MKKTLTVPFIPELDNMPLEKVSDVLEEKSSRQVIESLNWSDRFPYKPITIFDIARSEKNLYINFFVRGNCLRAVNTKNNSSVWEDSCVEFFVRVPGKDEYYNFEFNCIGACLAARRTARKENVIHFTDDQLARIGRYSSVGNKPFEEMEGIFAWELLAVIPFDLIGVDPIRLPEKIYANFYKCADATALPHYLSWSPIDTPAPDFHRPEFFGELYLK